jgi:hypothetical protein
MTCLAVLVLILIALGDVLGVALASPPANYNRKSQGDDD